MQVEETIYLITFTDAISSALRSPDTDFVRYAASKAGIQRQFNARFIESVTPIVKQAIQRSVSEMVVSGLFWFGCGSSPSCGCTCSA